MTTPEDRRKQLHALLAQIRNINNPVILAGDMNTSTHNATPVGVTRALKQRFGSAKWWAEEGATEAIKRATPFGWGYDISHGLIGFARGVDEPTEGGEWYVVRNARLLVTVVLGASYPLYLRST